MALFAIHIADGVLTASWCTAGYVVATVLAVAGAWRLRDEEIPRIALATAVFFVASQMHVPLGVSSAHLLLNGLVGVVLGRRALVAIPVGLFLQAGLFGHGGFSSLGVNSCVQAIPALLAAILYVVLRGVAWTKRPVARFLLVELSVLLWTTCTVYGVVLFSGFRLTELPWWAHLSALGGALLSAGVAAWWERKLETAPEFPIGLCIGELSVLGAIGLYCLALIHGGTSPVANRAVELEAERIGVSAPAAAAPASEELARQDGWRVFALVVFLAHLPIAALEALILGFLVGFLARVKPELIGWPTEDQAACPLHSVA